MFARAASDVFTCLFALRQGQHTLKVVFSSEAFTCRLHPKCPGALNGSLKDMKLLKNFQLIWNKFGTFSAKTSNGT